MKTETVALTEENKKLKTENQRLKQSSSKSAKQNKSSKQTNPVSNSSKLEEEIKKLNQELETVKNEKVSSDKIETKLENEVSKLRDVLLNELDAIKSQIGRSIACNRESEGAKRSTTKRANLRHSSDNDPSTIATNDDQ